MAKKYTGTERTERRQTRGTFNLVVRQGGATALLEDFEDSGVDMMPMRGHVVRSNAKVGGRRAAQLDAKMEPGGQQG